MNVCTIVAKNYLAHARVLARSLSAQHPDSKLTVLVLDDVEGFVDPAQEPFRLWGPKDIDCDAFEEMATQYSVIELSTAVKPWLLRRLLRDDDHAVYLDPDIQVVAPLDEVRDLARRYGIVLTPHNLTPIPRDGMYPSEESILMAGAYNLGFIAIGSDETAHELLTWWAERLETDCVVDPASGRFVDQKWIDLVPSIWPSTHLLRDPTYNIAYWNLHDRRLEHDDGLVTVDGRPVRFLHFSGYDPLEPAMLSKHQDRIRFDERPDVRAVADAYGRALLAEGFEETSRWPYSLAAGYASSDAGATGPLGVNVVGYLNAELGVGEVARQAIGALDAQAMPVHSVPVSQGVNREDHLFDRLETEGAPTYAVNLMCVNADMLATVAGELGPDFFAGRQTVGWWWWEVDALTQAHREAFELVDEIWAGSAFVASTLRSAQPGVPVVHVPTPVTMRGGVRPDRAATGLPEGFVFLFVFDFNSVRDRKNPNGLVEAFRRAFPDPGDSVRLVLKSINGERHPEALAALRATVGDRDDIQIRDEYLDPDLKDVLIASCDCYVSLHRSEGFGITLAEAMLLGRPVIGTAYSGPADYLSEATGYPVRSTLVEVGAGNDPYPADALWAEPDLDHAAELMLRVLQNPDEAAERARAGKEYVRSHHSAHAAGRVMAGRVRVLAAAGSGRSALGRSGRRSPADVAQDARTDTLELIRRPTGPAPESRAGALADRVTSRVLRRTRMEQREIDQALWWSVETGAVAAADLLRRLERLEHENRRLDGTVRRLTSARRQQERRTAALEERVPQLDELWASAAAEPFMDATPFSLFDTPRTGRVVGYRELEPAATFEDVFRGGEAMIRERQRRYVELLNDHALVLDVGCGRGELLEVLGEAGIRASGVDSDPAMVARCHEKGLDHVERADAVACLQNAEQGSLGAVTALQLAEHLAAEALRDLLVAAHRALRDGGRLVVETVNPYSSRALRAFWVDLTHRHPIFPETLLQMCREVGFTSAMAFAPNGSGDWEHDRAQAGEYVVVAER